MAQGDILMWLGKKRIGGDVSYFSPLDVYMGMKDIEASTGGVRLKLSQLFEFGFLDMEQEGLWRRKYRLKEKYLGLIVQ